MKKLSTIFMMVIAVALLLSISAFAGTVDGKCGDTITWRLDTSTGELDLVGSGVMYDYTIASNATANTPWYSYRSYIKTVNISEGITRIGSSAFYACSNLTEIEFPESVTHLGNSCFKNCSSIAELVIPDTVKVMENEAFYQCIRLESLSIGSGLTELNSKVFAYCSGLSDICVPSNIKEIKYNAFFACAGATFLTISEGVEIIGLSAFSYCTALSDVVLPWSLKTIDNGAFSECSSLTSLLIPKSVTSIGVGAFNNCADGFGLFGFYGTRAESFAETYGIPFWAEQTQISEGPCGIELTWRFDSSTGELSIYGDGDMYDFADSLSPWYEYCKQITSYTFEGNVTRIGDYAFQNCYQIDSISIPETVTSIGRDAFYGTTYFNDSSNWGIAGGSGRGELYIDGCLIDVNDLGGDYEVKEGTRVIADYAFAETSPIVVLLPDSLEYIGKYVFAGLPIIDIALPESVKYIGDGAFSDCTSLISIVLPESVTTITSYMFKNCSMLDGFTIPSHITRIEDWAFRGSSISDPSVYDVVEYIGFGAFEQCYSIDNVYVYNDNIDIGPYALGTALAITIHGREGSTAQAYAELNGMDFEILDSECSHQYVDIYVEATCTQNGFRGKSCIKCDYSYGAASAAVGHSGQVLESVLPTCTKPGYSTSECYNCGEIFTNEISATGHSFGDWRVDLEPQVGTAGSKSRTCSACGEIETEEIAALAPVGITGTCGDSLNWSYEQSSGILTVYGSGDMYDYTVGTTPWNAYLTSIKQVVIAEGPASVGKYAFSGATSLESVIISNSVTRILASAFASCTALKEVTLGNSITTIGQRAFDGSKAIKTVNIPDFDSWCKIKFGTIYSNPAAYSKCFYVNGVHTTEVVLTEATTSINAYAFRGTDIKKITIPASVTSIDTTALAYTTDLVIYGYGETTAETFAKENEFTFVSFNCGPDLWWEIDTETGILSITGSGRMFDYSSGFNAPWYPYYTDIKTVVLSPDVTSIGKYAFYNCIYIEELIIPDGVVTIQSNAFRICRALKKITIPQSVTTIGSNAFYGSNNVTIYGYVGSCAETYANNNSITFSPIDSDSASGKCGENLTWTYDGNSGVLNISGTGAMYDYTDRRLAPWTPFLSGITKIVIAEGVTYVGNYSFTYCRELKEITIPTTLYHMGIRAVENCTKLEKVHVKDFDAWCGITFDTMGANPVSKAHSFYVDGKHVTKIVISDSVTEIKAYAFRSSDIEEITVPKSVLTVGESAFSYCNNVTVYSYGETAMEAYAKEAGLNFVAFDCGPDLTWSVTAQGATLNINGSGRMHNYSQGFGSPWTPYRSQITTVNLDDAITTIGKYAFYYCVALENITLPETITQISESAFRVCRKLESISIPEGVTLIDKAAFNGCSALSKVYIYSTDVTFGTDVFNACPDVTIYGYSGSTAETYAKENAIPFEVIKEEVECSHDMVVTESTATCTESGIITSVCSLCGYTEIQEQEALGHKNVASTVKPTCTDGGYTVDTCSVCGETSEKYNVVDALGHSYGEWEIDVEATCTENGSRHKTCISCGDVVTEEITTSGHDYVKLVTEPTCITGGYTTYTCSSCGDTYKDDYVDALEHDYGLWEPPYNANCDQEYTTYKTCIRCGHDEMVIVPAAGHCYEEAVTEPTCTDDGYTTYTCFICGDTYINDYVDALGHSYGEWETDVEATCINDGERHKTCTGCGDTVTETVPATGHKNVASTIEPTCTEYGYSIHTCSACGSKETISVIPANGHKLGDWIIDREATSTESGLMHRDCQNCDYTEEQTIAPVGETPDAIFTLSSAEARPGETVKLTISLKTAVPVNSIALRGVTYDKSCLEFVGFTVASGLEEITALPPIFDEDKMNIVIALSEDTVFDGDICTLEFIVSENATDCVSYVTATPIVKLNSSITSSNVKDAEVKVYTYVTGDIDGDEDVDVDDAVLLFCYSMIPEDYPINYRGDVDFTKDGKVDINDAITLFNYSMLPDIYPIG